MKLYNTLSRRIEEFKPINPPKVGMYTCGPTVYDFMHIGNLRTFVFSDILRRVLQMNGYEVTAVQNITDIDDKIIKRAKERGISTSDLAEEFTEFFLKDIDKLNILFPSIRPKATEHIGKMIKYIEILLKKDLAYIEKDGSVYFDISKFPDYGKLSQVDKRELKTGTRILSDEYTKDNVYDFALWKAVKGSPSTSSGSTSWDSPWGWGRPGWHIECSVMSQEYLGDTFDIHTGGIDLIFPHHENEIAQAEGKTGKPFVNYFVHGEHILVDGAKMSKSLKNFYTLKDLADKGFDPIALRYLFLTAHYRDKLNFTWKSLEGVQNGLDNLREIIRDWDESSGTGLGDIEEKFMDAMNNDLNTPQALAILWEMVKSDNPSDKKSATLIKMDQILGLDLDKFLSKPLNIPDEIMKMVEKRENARSSGDFKKSDKLRKDIESKGYEIEDTPAGPKIKIFSVF